MKNRSFEELKRDYEKAKKEESLKYLMNPTPSNVFKCLNDFITLTKVSKVQEKAILAYFLKTKGDISKLVRLEGASAYRVVQNFFNGISTNPDTPGIRPLLNILLDFDLSYNTSSDVIIPEIIEENTIKEKSRSNSLIRISDISSGKTTKIHIKGNRKLDDLDIEKIKSGEDTELDI